MQSPQNQPSQVAALHPQTPPIQQVVPPRPGITESTNHGTDSV